MPWFIFFQPEHSSSYDRRISYIEISSLRYDCPPCSRPMTNRIATHRIYSLILWGKMNSGVVTQWAFPYSRLPILVLLAPFLTQCLPRRYAVPREYEKPHL